MRGDQGVIQPLRCERVAIWALLANVWLATACAALTWVETFDAAGKPAPPGTCTNCYWRYTSSAYAGQSGWRDFVPGDGHAYLTVGPVAAPGDYQSLYFGLVGPGHRIEARLKGAAVRGYTGFLFMWMGPPANEIDIEIVPEDLSLPSRHSATDWSDARFNTFRDGEDDSTFRPVTNGRGAKVSLFEDDTYHTLSIDWLTNQVDYRIDGVLQHTVRSSLIPAIPAQVVLGFRKVGWAGNADWTGTRTMTVDWLAIHPIAEGGPVALSDEYSVRQGNRLAVPAARGVLANDSARGRSARLISPPDHGALRFGEDGAFTYDPNPRFVGRDQFVYRNTGVIANEESNAAVVWISVGKADNPPPHAP